MKSIQQRINIPLTVQRWFNTKDLLPHDTTWFSAIPWHHCLSVPGQVGAECFPDPASVSGHSLQTQVPKTCKCRVAHACWLNLCASILHVIPILDHSPLRPSKRNNYAHTGRNFIFIFCYDSTCSIMWPITAVFLSSPPELYQSKRLPLMRCSTAIPCLQYSTTNTNNNKNHRE